MSNKARVFPYSTRTLIAFYVNNEIIIGYQASIENAEIIAKRYGDDYVFNYTDKGNEYKAIVIGGYSSNNRNYRNFPTESYPEKLNGITNKQLNQQIRTDPNFYRLATGNSAPNSTTVDPNTNTSLNSGNSTPLNPNENQYSTGNKITRLAKPLTYPSDMSTSQDRIKFQAYQRDYKQPRSLKPNSYELQTPITNAIGEAVFLAIQSPISDQNLVSWGEDTISPIELKAVQLAMNAMRSTSDELGNVFSTAFKDAQKELKNQSLETNMWLAGQAVGVNNLVSRTFGKVINSNVELLFQSPQLRPFSFTFKLSPRNGTEAEQVKKIINYFKKNMAPIIKDDGLFLQAPNTFEIQYQKGGEQHKSLNKIKRCALTNCSVDYTPLGSYMTYNDDEGTMVSYSLNLQFQEIEPVYSRDYDDGHPIGF